MKVIRRDDDVLEMRAAFQDRPYYASLWWVLLLVCLGLGVVGLPWAVLTLQRPVANLLLGAGLGLLGALAAGRALRTRTVTFSPRDGMVDIRINGWTDSWQAREPVPLDAIHEIAVQTCVRPSIADPRPYREDRDTLATPHYRLVLRTRDGETVPLTPPDPRTAQSNEAAREEIESFLARER